MIHTINYFLSGYYVGIKITIFLLDFQVRSPQHAQNQAARPSFALANKMKGLRKDVKEKLTRLRSRSAERISKRSLRNRSPSQRSTSTDFGQENEEEDEEEEEEEPEVKSHANFRMTKSISGLPEVAPAPYNGPFIGRARALVDYIPSPYDRDALRFNVSKLSVTQCWWSGEENHFVYISEGRCD